MPSSVLPPDDMRPADDRHRTHHLLEDLAEPAASLTGGNISVWVYMQDAVVREIVLSGHAESGTCSRATTLITETVKRLGPGVDWFLTCGAAHVEVDATEVERAKSSRLATMLGGGGGLPPAMLGALMYGLPPDERNALVNQHILKVLVNKLRELAGHTGLISVMDCPWEVLVSFRQAWSAAARSGQPQVLVPDGAWQGRVADFRPIVPERTGAHPLRFHFEGWDFDDPRYQNVARIHRQCMQREFFSDAQRRRLTYRKWLKEWLTSWLRDLTKLPKEDAFCIPLILPAPTDEVAQCRDVSVEDFLTKHIAKFSGEPPEAGQAWWKALGKAKFGQLTHEQLHHKTVPDTVTEIDFERCATLPPRPGTEADAKSLHDRITSGTPGLISESLRHIQQMDEIIAPYESDDDTLRADDNEDAETARKRAELAEHRRFIDRLNRCIVLETMIRGWPSFFLRDERDQTAFEEWASEQRAALWQLMVRQAEQAGVSTRILRENNVVYDIRFNDDLGCTVQPLMLVDDAAHVQLHGSLAGASVALPLRRKHKPLQKSARGDGDNRTRASALMADAARLASGATPDVLAASKALRQSLGCHPPLAGRLLLQIWLRRLEAESELEFSRARDLIEGMELAQQFRFDEALQKLTAHLEAEPAPVPDAVALAGLCELAATSSAPRQLLEAHAHLNHLDEAHKKIIKASEPLGERLRKLAEQGASPSAMEHSLTREEKWQLERLNREQKEIEQEIERVKSCGAQAIEVAKRRVEFIEKMLRDPNSIESEFPMLARAAREAPEILRKTIEKVDDNPPLWQGLYNKARLRQCSREYDERYHEALEPAVMLLGLLDASFAISFAHWEVKHRGADASEHGVPHMQALLSHLWLPDETLRSTLKHITKEFEKGGWDRLLTSTILGLLDAARGACYKAMNDAQATLSRVSLPPLTARLAIMHFTHLYEGNYQSVFEMLTDEDFALPLREALGGIPHILNTTMENTPAGTSFELDASGTVLCVSPEGRTPLVRFSIATEAQTARAKQILANLNASHIPVGIASLAVKLLYVPVPPPRNWQIWREVLLSVRREILAVLSSCGHEACLFPDYALPLSPREQERENERDTLTPMDAPEFDRSWQDIGDWRALLPATTIRRSLHRQL